MTAEMKPDASIATRVTPGAGHKSNDFTLLVLFPFVFGYLGVLFIEAKGRLRAEKQRLEDRREIRIATSARALAKRVTGQLD